MFMIKIAIATDDEKTVSNKLLTEVSKYKIYTLDVERRQLIPEDTRENSASSKAENEELACKLLLEKVLNDVNVVIASICTRYEYYYLLSNNVQVLLVEEGTPIELVEEYLRRVLEELETSGEEDYGG